MIKSALGRTTIEGTNLDVLTEFISIFSGMLETTPEAVLATALAFEDDLDKVVEKSDPKILRPLIAVAEKVKGAMQDE